MSADLETEPVPPLEVARETDPVRPRAFRLGLGALALALAAAVVAEAHDIPNARVDRSTQVTIAPGRLTVDYEVSLSELTLTQELRGLIGALPGAGRNDWLAAYGRETGPLNAKGFLVTLDGAPLTLRAVGFEVKVEEHPTYRFRFEAELPNSGRIRLRDSNFESSEGTSRLALRGDGVIVRGSDVPTDLASVPARPIWQLSDLEERRTRSVEFEFDRGGTPVNEVSASTARPLPPRVGSRASGGTGLVGLLDPGTGTPWRIGLALAFGLGLLHVFQPGHGKTLILATAVDRWSWGRVTTLAGLTTLVHMASVVLIALILWWTTTERFGAIHLGLARVSGYLIATVGVWRLGRVLGGFAKVDEPDRPRSRRGILALGFAGGLVPCWDAVALVLVGAVLGRLGWAVGLAAAFSLGMGAGLAAVGILAVRFRNRFGATIDGGAWPARFGFASGLALTVMGLSLLTLARWI